MDETDLPQRPPLVLFRDRVAWLRARRQTDLGVWTALIYWPTMIGVEHCVREQWVTFADIAQIPGEDYTAVPTLT